MKMNDAPTLRHARVRLEQLSLEHAADLALAVADGELHRHWFAKTPTPAGIEAEISERLALQRSGSMAPYAIIDEHSQRAVGATTYLHIDQVNHRLEIGATFLARSAQRTGINATAKLLLLTRAFEDLGCIAVEFRTHWHNRQSRQAIERLGAKLDGVLRNHQYDPQHGTLRDTVVYSILPHEWPAVRAELLARVEASS